MSNLKKNIREQVLQSLSNLGMDKQEIKGTIDFGMPTDKAIEEDFTYERMEANDVFRIITQMEEELTKVKMLLTLLKD